MSLVDESMETFVMMNYTTVPDGEGGFIRTWQDGAEFRAAATFDSSMQARIAQSAGVSSLYTVTTAKNAPLRFHDVIKRKSDGRYFRITSDGTDKKTPESASFQYSQVTAEAWEIEQ